MDRHDLEPQLQGILSDFRCWCEDTGHGPVSELISQGYGTLDELDESTKLLYKVELSIMDLIVQLRTEPDRMRLEPDGNDPWVEVCDARNMDNTVMGQFGNAKQAVEFVERLPQSEQKNVPFALTKCTGGKYTSIENMGMIALPVKVE